MAVPDSRLSAAAAARLFRLLSDPTRLRLLLLLGDREVSVGDLAAAAGLSQQLVTHHLAMLRRGGVVERRRQGKHNLHRICSPFMVELLGPVREG